LPAGTLPYIVTFAPGTPEARQAEILAAAGVTDVSSIPQLAMHGVLLHDWLASDEVNVLRAASEVVRVDEDRTREAGTLPSDAEVASQWALPQIGWTDLYGTAAPAGSAVVAVLDTGIDGSHPDLDGVVLPGTSMLDGGNGLVDPNGHGTAMAGIVAAETDNAFGVAGTAYAGVSLLPVTVLDAAGLGQDSNIIGGVVHAADAGADVILMAFSNPGYSPALQAALDYAWSHGAVLVAAVGNDGSTAVTYPAGDRGVIGVAATDASDALAAGSNAGAAAFMAAPGVGILTTAIGGGSGWVSGSSASAAEVAGAAALLRALDPGASNGAIVGRLARNADATASAGTGNGRLNMARAAADASTEEVQPAGAAPLGSGGPIVGPYVAAARNWALLFAGTGSGAVQITPNTGTVDARVGCGGTGNPASSQTVTSSCDSPGAGRVTTSANGATITLHAMPSSGSVFSGWSAGQNISSGTCFDSQPIDLTNPCTVVLNGNGTLTVGFSPAGNAAPVANGDAYSTDEDTVLTVAAPGVLGNDTDADGNALTAALVTGPIAAQGALSLSANGAFTFTPAANFNGLATFTYRVNDGTANSNTATVTITVNAVDDAPAAANDAASVMEDAGTTTIDVLANDTDTDGGPMTVTSVSQPAHGSSAVTNGGADVSYTPAADICGSDTFSYTLNGGSTASVTVTVTCLNDPPVAADDSASVSEDSVANQVFVLGNDADIDGDTLTVVSVTQPANGSASAQLGHVTYTPDPDYNGTDSFTYTITDGQGGTSTASVTVSVGAVNDAPLAADDTYSTSEDVALDVSAPGVLANDGDVDLDALSATLIDDVTHGVLVLDADGSFTYTPTADFHGTDGFTYTAGDGLADSNVATVTITVLSVNDAPVLAPIGAQTVDEEVELAFNASATDVDGDALIFSLADGAGGDVPLGAAISPDGAFSWTPDENQGPATYTFDVCVSDGIADPVCETVTITVSEVNVAPVLDPVSDQTVDEGSSVTFTATASDVDLPSNVLSFSLEDGAGSIPLGASIDPGTGAFSWTSADNGVVTFDVCVTDDGDPARADCQPITITVSNVDPVVDAGAGATIDEGSTFLDSGSFTDPGTDSWTATVDYGDASGVQALAIDPDKTFALSHLYADNGSFTVTVTVTDDDGGSGDDTLSVTVNNVAPSVELSGPETVDESAASYAYGFVVSDPGDDTFTVSDLDCGTGGALVDDSLETTLDGGSFDCLFLDGPADPIVGITVLDDDLAVGADTLAVNVQNAKPIYSAPLLGDLDNQAAKEGTSQAFDLGSFTDAGTQDQPWAVEVDWGDGTAAQAFDASAQGAIDLTSHTYAQDGNYNVMVSVTDKDGMSDSGTFTISVANVAPAVDAGTSATIDEGSTFSGAGSFADPGADTWTATVDYGDGSGVQPLGLSGKSFTLGHAYAQDGTYPVTVCVTDDDEEACDGLTVTVTNVAPVVDAGAGGTIDEGGSFTGSGSFTDPGADTWTATVDYGDGSGVGALSLNPDKSFALTHVYADDGSYTVTVTVADDDAHGSDTLTVSVKNVAPDFSAAAGQSSLEGAATSFDIGSFTDPGTDSPWRITIQWGDGSPNTVLGQAAPGAIPAQTHAYADNGAYTVTVGVTEENGAGPGSDSGTFQVVVANVAPSVTGTFLSIDPVTRIVSASAGWTDPGADTYSATFEYFVNSASTPVASRTVVPSPASAMAAVDNLTQLPAGCYTLTMKVTVTDDDSGTAIGQQSTAGPIAIYAAAFQAPIKDNERNIAKYGNVVPVKVQLTNPCSGASVTTPSLFITIVQGNVSDDSVDDTPNLVAESVSSADTGAQMRLNGTGYIYNFSTKQLKAGSDYTIRIRVGDSGGPIIARALFQPKK
jgi:VCBS repeat-containing protein